MMLIGVDYHPSFQTIVFFIEETGECGEQELDHSDGEAERFYRDLQRRGCNAAEAKGLLDLDPRPPSERTVTITSRRSSAATT